MSSAQLTALAAVLSVTLGAVLVQPADAEITVADYLQLKSTHPGFPWSDLHAMVEDPAVGLVKVYILGVGEGFAWANVYLSSESALANLRASTSVLLFCQPEKLALNGDNYLLILDREIGLGRYSSEMPIAAVLLAGLKRTFPCRYPTPPSTEPTGKP